jgi:hypothetical protein
VPIFNDSATRCVPDGTTAIVLPGSRARCGIWNLAASGVFLLQRPFEVFEMLGTILIIVLLLLLFGAWPSWPHSRSWGYYPSGGLGLVLIVVLVLVLVGRF